MSAGSEKLHFLAKILNKRIFSTSLLLACHTKTFSDFTTDQKFLYNPRAPFHVPTFEWMSRGWHKSVPVKCARLYKCIAAFSPYFTTSFMLGGDSNEMFICHLLIVFGRIYFKAVFPKERFIAAIR